MDEELITSILPEDYDPPEGFLPDDTYFFDVVNSLTNLYVTFRGRYVMAIGGKVFIPHCGRECKKLDNRAIIGHLNQNYAIGVFSAMSGSIFLCFDIDLPDPDVVYKVIHGLCTFGFPKEYIYVSTSGGKGFHVEIFFNGLVYLNLLHNLYLWVIRTEGLDPKKVEFRPTFGQAIKLPLSKHHKTGNICWYLDRDTLEPIKSIGYVTTIVQMDRDAVETLIKEKLAKVSFFSENFSSPTHARFIPSVDYSEAQYTDEVPMMTGPGMRHNLMKSIAVHERYKGTSQEEISVQLKTWLEKQNPDFITDPWDIAVQDAENLASYVWNDKFALRSRKLIITQGDLETVISCHAPLQKRVLFLIVLFCRRYGVANLSAVRISRYTGCTPQAVQKALSGLERRCLIEKKPGKVVYTKGQFVSGMNSYKYKPNLNIEPGEQIEVQWDFKENTFMNMYNNILRCNILSSRWRNVFTKKEIIELEGEKENG